MADTNQTRRKAKAALDRKKTGPKGPSKPMTDVDYERAKGAAAVMATATEIAMMLGMDKATLDIRLKERGYDNFTDFKRQHRMIGKVSLRRAQFAKALHDRNSALLIWLGKQYLDQKDQSSVNHSSDDGSMTPAGNTYDLGNVSDATLAQLHKEMLGGGD